MALTRKQAAIFEFIREFIEKKPYSPSLEEIAEHFGISTVTTHEHVAALEAKGALRTVKHQARSIELIEEPRWPHFPVLGRIAAGLPIEAVHNEESFDFDSVFPTDRDCFMLEVKGQSMIDDHIEDGDLVIVESRDVARAGETVVALVREEEATLKVFYPEGAKIRLEPANARMKPIIENAQDVRIQGVVIGVIRRY